MTAEHGRRPRTCGEKEQHSLDQEPTLLLLGLTHFDGSGGAGPRRARRDGRGIDDDRQPPSTKPKNRRSIDRAAPDPQQTRSRTHRASPSPSKIQRLRVSLPPSPHLDRNQGSAAGISSRTSGLPPSRSSRASRRAGGRSRRRPPAPDGPRAHRRCSSSYDRPPDRRCKTAASASRTGPLLRFRGHHDISYRWVPRPPSGASLRRAQVDLQQQVTRYPCGAGDSRNHRGCLWFSPRLGCAVPFGGRLSKQQREPSS